MGTIYKHFFLTCLLFCAALLSAHAQTSFDGKDIVGRWRTTDDKTGKVKSVVQIYSENNKYFGKIVQIFREPHEDQDPSCSACEDYRKNQKIIGLVIIRNMAALSNKYGKGDILDPETGDVYTCEIWLEDKNTLKVRGWWGFFYRTQTWQRAD